MESYFVLICNLRPDIESKVVNIAMSEYSSMGVEEFSIDEPRVDEILGERSYSGGDVPESVIQEVEEVVTSDSTYRKFYFETELAANSFKSYLNQELDIESKIKVEKTQDWNEEWKKTYKPIFVSERLEIIPEWEKSTYKSKSEYPIFIYPGMGFGTGSHETTFLCLKIFSELKPSNSCLDFGCGSGILGIGYKLLNKSGLCDLYDIDPQALENCRQNITLNDLDEKDFDLLLPKDRGSINKKYQLVFANILQNVLLVEGEYLANSLMPGGDLILSGLLAGQEVEVINAYLKLNSNLTHVSTEIMGDWVAVHLKN